MQYRTYQSGDERSIVELWNECLTKDPITPLRFRKLVLLDANFDSDGLRLAFDGDKLAGCVYAVRRQLPMHGTELEPANGWIPFFFVSSAYRRQGVGRTLMQQALQFLKDCGRTNVYFSSYAPNYILPGIDEANYTDGYQFLLSQGFKKLYSPVAMNRTLVGYEIPEDIRSLKREREAEGFTFRTAQDEDLYELIQFATSFNPDWGRAIREGLLQKLPMSQIFVCRNPQKKLVGFCLYGGYEGIRERFGPFGVDPDIQGKGLGKILLNVCMEAMRAEGLHGIWFLWTAETTPAGHLYKRTGFETTRKFHVMLHQLASSN